MPYVDDARPLVAEAHRGGFALAAFNVCSAEMVRACVEAAAELSAPILLQTYPDDLEQLEPRAMVALVRAVAHRSRAPVALHLDHGRGFDMAMACLRAGYGSVMFDGAGLALDEVAATTRRIARVAHAQGAAVEVAAESFNHGSATLSRPEDVERLFDDGGADMVAVSVGSEHGRSAALDAERLAAIAARAARPLVLHGGSGVAPEDLARALRCGVVKVNVGSGLYRALRAVWSASEDAASHRVVYRRARDAVRAVALERIGAMGATGRAASGPEG